MQCLIAAPDAGAAVADTRVMHAPPARGRCRLEQFFDGEQLRARRRWCVLGVPVPAAAVVVPRGAQQQRQVRG
eukprot:6435927-Prymnesium_polylepis.1